MKVRDEPMTPCTMEMLPASRFDSCARNSVGRRSLISRSLRNASGSAPWRCRSRIAQSTAMSRSPPPAATIMSVRAEHVRVALDAGVVEREPGGIGADALPGSIWRWSPFLGICVSKLIGGERMDDVGREGLGRRPLMAARRAALPVRVRPFAEAGDDADPGDPGFARFGVSHGVSALHREIRCVLAISSMCPRNSGSGNGITRNVSSALQTSLPPTVISALVIAKPEPSCTSFAVSVKLLPGHDEGAQLGFLDRGQKRHALEIGQRDAPASRRSAPSPRSAARPASADSRGNGPRRWCWRRNLAPRRGWSARPRSRSTIRSMSWKYSRSACG